MKGRKNQQWSPDLGLAILEATTTPPHTNHTIAAYMGVSPQRVDQIVQHGLRRIRARLYRDKQLQSELKERMKV